VSLFSVAAVIERCYHDLETTLTDFCFYFTALVQGTLSESCKLNVLSRQEHVWQSGKKSWRK